MDHATTTLAPPETPQALDRIGQTQALDRWEALAIRVAVATEEAEALPPFDYHDKLEAKACRSHCAKLRRIKGDIERARKEAKAVHLERGRAVDDGAKTLAGAIDALIEPHEQALRAIEDAEAARVQRHQAVIAKIKALGAGTISTPGEFDRAAVTSAEFAELANELEAIDTSGLEEFTAMATTLHRDAVADLQAKLKDALQREEEARELARLREEQAVREQQERDERIRQEAKADALRELGVQAKPVEPDAFRTATDERELFIPSDKLIQPAAAAVGITRDELIASVAAAIRGKSVMQLATALADGTLHPAIGRPAL